MKTVAFTAVVLLICSSVAAQTSFKGGIYSNTTWTKANSPYIITGDVVVFPSKTLTIEPGVEIKFDGNYYFDVRGKLNSIGNAKSPIIFTSNKAQPQKGDWIGLNINIDQGGKAGFEYTNFYFAYEASIVTLNNHDFEIGTYFLNCIFENNFTSLQSSTVAGWGFRTNVDNCIFSNNNYGIKGGLWNIVNSGFFNNSYGLFETFAFTVKSSTFQNNIFTAINAYGSTIDSCLIDNNGIGIKIDLGDNNSIHNNTITGNSIGIQYSAQTYVPNYFGFGGGSVSNNLISNNLVYNAENGTIQTRNLTGNNWGITDSTAIEDKLKDGYDDIKLGLINYDISLVSTLN